MSTHSPISIANFFIEKAKAEGKPLTPIEVIKMVYLAHGWYLGLTEEPLINEPPEAWRYGPVIPSLYHELKVYGRDPVKESIAKYSMIHNPSGIGLGWTACKEVIPPPSDESLKKFLNDIWESYKGFSGFQLSELTHEEGTPWSETWEKVGKKYSGGADIPEDLIKKHYQDLIKKMRERAPSNS